MIVHRPDCTGPDLHTFTGAKGDRIERCASCGRFYVLPDTDDARPIIRPRTPEPEPVSVDWPTLMARAEARGVPVSRVADRGRLYLIRTSAELAQEWE